MQVPRSVGIDVAAKTYVAAWECPDGRRRQQTFANSQHGHQQLIAAIDPSAGCCRVVIEATGVYSLGLALSLHATDDIEVMLVNPRAAKDFARANMTRAKTDGIDADSLMAFVQRMPFVPWTPPPDAVLKLRGLTRRLHQLKLELHREGNRAKQAEMVEDQAVVHDIDLNMRHLQRRVDKLQDACLDLIQADDQLNAQYQRITSVPGIASRTAPVLLAELGVLAADMKGKQWVAHAGLDPRPFESGTSINKPRRISKVGNRYLRHALYMPALVAIRNDQHIAAYYAALVQRGKKPKQAIIAVMRKLLLALHGMERSQTPFDPGRFYRLPADAA